MSTHPGGGKMKTILAIDDESLVRNAYQYALEGKDYRLLLAENGEQGLAIARENRPDLVFLDLKMPGIDGVETLRRLMASDPQLNVYIVTGFQQEYMDSLKAAMDEGLKFEVAAKPLAAEQIEMIARIALENATFVQEDRTQ
jgi:DNA-binding NtrC family response regulator